MKDERKPRSPRGIAARLVHLLPADFQDRFGLEMEEVLKRDLEDASLDGKRGRSRYWFRTLASLLIAIPREHLADLATDLRYTGRTLRKRPAFTLTAVLSLAIGIGAMTTVLAIFDATFGSGIPGVPNQKGLINVKVQSNFEETFQLTSYPNWQDLRASGVLQELAGSLGMRMSYSAPKGSRDDASEPELRSVQGVTGNYFSVLELEPRLGRLLNEDDISSAEPVAVISSWLWRERLGKDPKIIGRELRLNGEPFTVVGVTGEGFRGHFIGFTFDIFITTSMKDVANLPEQNDRGADWLEMFGRLQPNQTLEQSRLGFELQASALEKAWPEVNRGLEITVEKCSGIDADLRGGLATFLIILGGVAGFVLLIACVNVANLMLSRLLHRQREISIRMAMGAPRSRLARQLMTEATVLALLGGGLGVLSALWATSLASRTVPALGGINIDVALDPRAILAALIISLLAALVFGLLPALQASRAKLSTFTRGSSSSSRTNRVRGALVVGQVALSVVVLVAAGLFLRALQRASAIDPGFNSSDVLQVRLSPSLIGMDAAASNSFFEELLERASGLPGVEVAALADGTPLSLGARFFPNTTTVQIPGMEPPEGRDGFQIEHMAASQGYLEALQIPVIAGRVFSRQDTARTQGVAVINETFVARFFESNDAIGSTLKVGEQDTLVIGVVRDSRYRTLNEEPMPYLYLPFAQAPSRRATLLLRMAPGRDAVTAPLRDIIRSLAPELPFGEFGALDDQLAISLLPQRVAGSVATALGLIGLFLTATGLYGVLAYTVSCRSAEIGVRMSLGAEPRDVLRLILRLGLTFAAIGLAVGLPVAALTSKVLASFLYGVSPFDPVTYLSIAILLSLTAAIAGLLPALRAARIDPLIVLRSE